MAREQQAQTIVAIERAADVLTLFADAEEATLGVTEIASALGLSKAVVYRILSSFRAKGFVDLDESTRRYSLGPRVLDLGLAYMDRTEIRTIARPEMERLCEETGETVTLSLRTGPTRVYVDQVTPNRDIKMVVRIGQHAPLHAGGSSKAFLAFLDPEEQEGYLSMPLEKHARSPRREPCARSSRRSETAAMRCRWASGWRVPARWPRPCSATTANRSRS